MRIEAIYSDGFSADLLHWKLVVNNGKASLEADWFKNSCPLRAKFRFDEDEFRSFLPLLAGMEENYRASWEDLENRDLVVIDGDSSLHHHVYGAGVFVANKVPPVINFLKVWKLLEAVVLARLPANLHINDEAIG